MALTPTTSLAEIATANPSLRRELERLGLDYCCGGKRSLAEACHQQDLDPDVIVAALASLSDKTEQPHSDWADLSPSDLVDHLESTHHRYLKEELPRLSALAEKVSRVHGENHPELVVVAEVFAELRDDLEPHLRKEEEVLFPMIRTLATACEPTFHCGSLSNPITVMEQEHVVVGKLLEKLRQITGGYQAPEGTCASTQALMEGLAQLEADTHLHVHKENNQLFPAVIAQEAALRG